MRAVHALRVPAHLRCCRNGLIHSAVFATHTPLHEPLHRATACEYARTNACRPAVGRLVASATLHQLIDLEQPRPHTPPCPDGYSPLTCRAA